jgi:hypothetical protein
MTPIGPSRAIDERDRQTCLIIGCALKVHRYLGSRFLEPVYQAALEVGLDAKQIRPSND